MLNSNIKSLQSNENSVTDVRILFDAVIAKFKDMESRLKWNRDIVIQPAFETGVAKMQNEIINSLSILRKKLQSA